MFLKESFVYFFTYCQTGTGIKNTLDGILDTPNMGIFEFLKGNNIGHEILG